jgi:hypothetical protein
MHMFPGMSETDAKRFTDRWLPAWTGNDPERLTAFYADDAIYSDPAVPDGVRPLDGGFLNYWHAVIPDHRRVVECDGVCTVTVEDGLIRRNEVLFHRTPLMASGSHPSR